MGRKSNVQKKNEQALIQQYIFHEAAKCRDDTIYFAEEYCKVYDRTQGGNVPFIVFETQKRILNALKDNDFTLFLKYRQAGISTTCAVDAAKQLLFADPDNPVKISIVANKLATAQEFLKKVKGFIKFKPEWWAVDQVNSNQTELRLSNGSEIRAHGTSDNALRGYTPNWIIIDEAADIANGRDFYEASLASLSTGGKMTLISTPKGNDPLFYEVYDSAKRGKNNFYVEVIYWWEDPRYTTREEKGKRVDDLIWKKGEKQKVAKDLEKRHELFEKGWKPWSSWYHDMCRNYNEDWRAINQELNCSFLGSSNTFIPSEDITYQETHHVREPDQVKDYDGHRVLFWKDTIGEINPKEDTPYVRSNGVYILGADVASGTGDDFSTIQVFNMVTGNQCAEYQGKIKPEIFGWLIYQIGMFYEGALAAVDSGGGWGHSTLIELKNSNYPNLYYSTPKSKQLKNIFTTSGAYNSNTDKAPGLNTGPVRPMLLNAMRKKLSEENQEIRIRSKRTTDEMHTFMDKGSRPDHMQGKHDDLLMALGIICYVYEHDFQANEKAKRHAQEMLKAISVNRSSMDRGSESISGAQAGRLVSDYSPDANSKRKSNPNDPNDFRWLFM